MTSTSRPLTVLVVDDELLLRWSLSEVLRQQGHHVVEATSAKTARLAMTNPIVPIDVVLLDYRLPDSHGLELLQEVRRQQPQSAVILMTAYVTPDVVEEALALGVHSVMSKPFDMHAVDDVVLNAHHRIRHH